MEKSWLIIVGLGILGIIAIRWASKVMAVIMGLVLIFLAILVTMYLLNAGPFKKEVASIEGLRTKFCQEELSLNKCDCIVDKIEKDILDRFSDAELKEIENNRVMMLGVAIKSFNAQEKSIDACLEARGASHEKSEFINEVFDGSGYIGRAKGLFSDFMEDYKMIEEKY